MSTCNLPFVALSELRHSGAKHFPWRPGAGRHVFYSWRAVRVTRRAPPPRRQALLPRAARIGPAQRDPGPGMVGGVKRTQPRARKQRVDRGTALTLASGSGHWLCAFVMLSRGAELICFMIVLVAFFSVGVLSGWRAWAEARVHWFTLHSVPREWLVAECLL